MGSATPQEPRTLDELLRQRAKGAPDVPIAAFPTTAEPDSYRAHTAVELDAYASRAAHFYQGVFGNRTRSSAERVVALLAPSDLDYLVALFALGRLGFTPLLLSTKLSPEAIRSLLEKTNCNDLVYSAEGQAKVESVAALRPLKTAL